MPKQNGFSGIIVLIVALILAGLAGAYYFGKSSNKSTTSQTQASVSPTSQPTSDEIANEQTYTSSKFTFRYPSNLVIEETEKDFILFTKKNTTPMGNSNMAIDARLSAVNGNYDEAVKSTKNGLTGVKEENIGKWLKISGLLKGPLREGTPLSRALYKYNQGAINFEISGNAPVSESTFNQILSTFKFLP